VVVLLASLTVIHVRPPVDRTTPKALYTEVDPVDQHVDIPSVPGQGGGSPGEMGGTLRVPSLATGKRTKPRGISSDLVTETILTDILPSTPPKPHEELQRALPGPQTIGQGLIPESRSGVIGGAGGGSGGGAGRGIGPGTQFFGARDHAHSFAYVIDCSGSMATYDSLDVAKREMLASISQLPPDGQFGVILYNLQARMLANPQGQRGLMAATALNKARVQNQLAMIKPDGGTDHILALRTALTLKPEVIFFLTDAEVMSNGDVNQILTEVGATRIQAIEFGRGAELGQRTPLARLATTTGGSYRYIDVSQFPKSRLGF